MDNYYCIKCKDEWEFCPDDYEYDESLYPTVCPFCQMSKSQLFHDIRKEEGIWQAIKEVVKRVRIWK